MKKIIVVFSLGLTLIFPLKNAYCVGSGAFRLEFTDAEALGKGSAFVAQADNPSAVYYNPAGLTQLKGKANISIGTAIIQPFSTYKDNSGNETDQRRQIFNVPHMYFVSDFGLEKFAFGIGATSYWGLGTYWAEDSFSRYVSTKSDLSAQDTMFTAAYEITDNISVGASIDYTMASVDQKKKLLQSGANDDGDLQLKGKDTDAWGYRLSTLYKLNENHQFGFMYRSPVKVKYKGKIRLDNLNDLGAYPYQSIFGGSSYETDITSKSTLPQSLVLGYCFKPNDKWKFETDIEWMDWSAIQEEKIDYPSESDPNRLGVLNDGNPTPKDWHSSFSYSFGVEYKLNESWKLRAGYFFLQTPIPEANFETSLPDSNSNSVTAGVGYKFNKNMGIDFAYAAMFYDKRKINNAIGASSGASINGKYNSFANIYMLTLSYKF